MKKLYFSGIAMALSLSLALAQNPINFQGDTLVCRGQSGFYQASSSLPEVDYFTFTSIHAIHLASTSQSATLHWPMSGNYNLKVKAYDSNSVAIDSLIVPISVMEPPRPRLRPEHTVACIPINPGPESPEMDSTECFHFCQGTQVKLTAYGQSVSSFNYIVNGGTIVQVNGDELTVVWDSIGQGSITVQETNAANCTRSKSYCVEVHEKPEADFEIVPYSSISSVNACTNRKLQFQDRSIAPGSNIVSWYWDFGDGTTSQLPNPTHTYTTADDYKILLVVENECSCKDSLLVNLSVGEAEALELECPAVVCEDQTVPYTVTDAGSCNDYKWTVIGGLNQNPGSSAPSINITWDNPTDGYGLIQVWDNCNGGSCPATFRIPVVEAEGEIKGPGTLCEDSRQVYQLPRWPGIWYEWSITGDANIYQTDQPNEILVVANSGGTQATLRAIYHSDLAGCAGKAKMEIEIIPRAEIKGPRNVCVSGDQNFDFHLKSNEIASWELFDDTGALVASANTVNFSPIFPAAGTYTIHASVMGYCPPKPYVVEASDEPPIPDFIDGPDSVCLDNPYAYTTGEPLLGNSLNWLVSGGQFSGGLSPVSGNSASVVFSGPGPYQLKVWRERNLGDYCSSDTLVKNIYPRTVQIDILGADTVCANAYEFFETSFKEGDNYEWSIFPETAGSVVNGEGTDQAEILWKEVSIPTAAQIVVHMRYCGNSFYDTLDLTVIPGPEITILAPDSICLFEEFSLSLSGNPALSSFSKVRWNFGDGYTRQTSTSSTQYRYRDSLSSYAYYTITATVEMPNGCLRQAEAQHPVVVAPTPRAFISPAGNRIFCNPTELGDTLTASAQGGVGNITGYQWYNGSSPIGGATGASFVVNTAGSFYCVISFDINCEAASNLVVMQQICDTTSGSSCPYEKHPGLSSLALNLDNCGKVDATVSYNTSNWSNPQWSGSASSFTANSATYHFQNPGSYGIAFRADSAGCQYYYDQEVIVPYLAGLRYQISCGSGGQYNVTLIDSSRHYHATPISNYRFYINGSIVQDGSNSTYQTSLSPGTHPIRLRISSPGYPPCNVYDTIVIPNYPSADFSFHFDGACVGYPIQFSDASTGGDLQYFWDFGDQASVRVENPSRVYASPASFGYPVTLTVTNALGCKDSITKTVNVSANELKGSSITPSSALACQGDSVLLSHQSIGSNAFPNFYYWMPDSFAVRAHPQNTVQVNEAGSYFVSVTDSLGCRASTPWVPVEFVPLPQPQINGPMQACAGEFLRFEGKAGAGNYQYQWFLGGTLYSSGDSLELPQGLPAGQYPIELQVSVNNPFFCARSYVDTLVIHTLPDAPELDYSLIQCDPYALKLAALVPGNPPGHYRWSNGGSTKNIEVSQGGMYGVIFTDVNGCTSEAQFYVPRSPEEYSWIYPLNCYYLCEDFTAGLESWDIPDPIVPFHHWAVNHSGIEDPSGSGVPDARLSFSSQSFSYSLEMPQGCDYTHGTTQLDFGHCECHVDVDPDDMTYHSLPNGDCENQINIHITNPYPEAVSINLSSDLGYFIPGSITLPPGPGTQTYNFQFVPFPGVAGGAFGHVQASGFRLLGEGEREYCNAMASFYLANPLCDAISWKWQGEPDSSAAAAEYLSGFSLEHWDLYPNPADHGSVIEYRATAAPLALRVLQSDGRPVLEQELSRQQGKYQINTQQWPAGLYLLTLHYRGHLVGYRRLAVQH